MNAGIERLTQVWREQSDTLIQNNVADARKRTSSLTFYASLTREQMLEAIGRFVYAWQAALEANDPAPMITYARQLGNERSASQVNIDEVMEMHDLMRKHIWVLMGQIYKAGDWDMDVVEQMEHWIHAGRNAIVSSYGRSLQEAWQHLAERERAFEDQGRLLQELSAPIVPIHEGVLVLPLVGAVDSRRATQIMESVLEKIVEYQADVLIMDITGVPIVDTGVANYLIQMARAVTLLGARVVLVGIGAEIAQTVVQLGVELRDITTLANLQAGIAYALAQQGFTISSVTQRRRDLSAIN